jgi:hypothetical protein
MKSRTSFRLAATAHLIVFVFLAGARAQTTPLPVAPIRTSSPESIPRPPQAAESSIPMVDPNTGLPITASEPQWIDSTWSDPDIILTNISYDGLLLSDVAQDLSKQFKTFDILPMPQAFGHDWGSEIIVHLQLRGVRASEIFNAMNLVFENDRTPVRWQLTAQFGRPLVQLRVLPEAAPQPPPPPKPPETRRMVYFVGNLLGDEKSGGVTMEQIVKTISDIWPAELGKPDGVIQFHKEAQLLVVNGTSEQLEFIRQTLAALEQKSALEKAKINSTGVPGSTR